MKSSGTYILVLLLAVLLGVFLFAKPSPEWIQAQMDKFGLGQTQTEESIPTETGDSTVIVESKPETTTPQKVTSVMYQWKDDKGNIQFTDQPPVDKPYKEIKIETKKGKKKQTRYSTRPPINTSPQNSNAKVAQSDNTDGTQSSFSTLSLQCRNKYSSVERFERKLDKEKDIPQSIWLQDYCSALGDFIQEECVLPKSEVKYNSYCPLRFRR